MHAASMIAPGRWHECPTTRVRVQNGYYTATITPLEVTTSGSSERGANGLAKPQTAYPGGLPFCAGSFRMSDDAKFILGFG